MEEEVLEKKYCGTQIRPEYSSFRRAKAIILQCPYEATASYSKGTKSGPEAIIDASEHMELFDDELKVETSRIGIHTKYPLALEGLDPEAMVDVVKGEVLDVLRSDKLPVLIGGEHSISIGAVRAASEVYTDLSVLHLDAHHDLRDEYGGTKFSHACVSRRFLECCPVVQMGTRSLSKDEQDFINSNPGNLKTVNVYDILETAWWKQSIVDALSDNVYISLDMDVFDPSLVPSVGTPEPGGIGWYELLDLIKQVSSYKKIVGFDVVELMPIQGFVASDFLAAKLIYRMLSYIFYGVKR